MATLPPEAQALLDTIASTESPGYNVLYGGGTFSGWADHPRQYIPITSGPNVGKKSSAAGRYQFLGSTWDEAKKALGLKDFSPASQDAAAWWLAQRDYNAATGQDLATVLRSGDPAALAGVGRALSGTWTSLPGGIEATTNTSRFANAYSSALGQPNNPALGAINSAAPNGINPLAYAPTPAGLPTMNRSGLIPPIPAGLPTMDRSGPPTQYDINGNRLNAGGDVVGPDGEIVAKKAGSSLPAPKPLTITLPNGSVVVPGKMYVDDDGSITTFDENGKRTHIPPPLFNLGKEAGSDTILGGLIRAKVPEVAAQVSQQVGDTFNTGLSAAQTKVAELGSGIGSAFGSLFGGGSSAPAVPAPPTVPKPATPPPAVPYFGQGSSVIPTAPKPPVNSSSSIVDAYAAGAYPSGQVAAPPSAYSSGYGAGDYGYTPTVPPPLPAPAPLAPPMGMTPALPQSAPAPAYRPPPIPTAQIATGKTMPLGFQGTAQGGRFGYFVAPDGSIINSMGLITSGPGKPINSNDLYNAMQASMRQGTFGGRDGGSLGTTQFGKSPDSTWTAKDRRYG